MTVPRQYFCFDSTLLGRSVFGGMVSVIITCH